MISDDPRQESPRDPSEEPVHPSVQRKPYVHPEVTEYAPVERVTGERVFNNFS